MRLYLDAAPVIYTVEQVSPFFSAVDARLSAAEIVTVASELTRMECRIKPLANADVSLLRDYEDFFTRIVKEMTPMTKEVFERAAEIRAVHKFKTPDALHLAAALTSACDIFFTNDARLNSFTAITIEVIPP